MKKIVISILMATLLCLSTCMAACNENQNNNSPTLDNAAEDQPGENETIITYTDLSDFLNEEQIEAYKIAQEIYPLFNGVPDAINTLHLALQGADFQSRQEYLMNARGQSKTAGYNINGIYYIASIGEYQTLSAFMELCLSVFTDEYFEELNNTSWKIPGFIEIDHHLYYNDVAKGSAFGYNPAEYPDTYELISRSDTEINFNIIGHYKSSNVDLDYTVSTQSFPVTMVLDENGWRFSHFSYALLDE